MPDIQAGEVEVTKQEAAAREQQKHASFITNGVVDETGEYHDESKFNHLGRS